MLDEVLYCFLFFINVDIDEIFVLTNMTKFIITVTIITMFILVIIVNTKKEMIKIILKLIILIIIMDVIIMAISFVQLRMLAPEI